MVEHYPLWGVGKLDRNHLGDPRPHPSLKFPNTSQRNARSSIETASHRPCMRISTPSTDAFIYSGRFFGVSRTSHDGAIRGKTFLIFPIRSPFRRDDWGYLATVHEFPASSLLCVPDERRKISSGDSSDGRDRTGISSTDYAGTSEVRPYSLPIISDASRWRPGPFTPSEKFVPGHFSLVHCGAIRDETFLTFPIRSWSRSDDSNCPETAHAFPTSTKTLRGATKSSNDRGIMTISKWQ